MKGIYEPIVSGQNHKVMRLDLGRVISEALQISVARSLGHAKSISCDNTHRRAQF